MGCDSDEKPKYRQYKTELQIDPPYVISQAVVDEWNRLGEEARLSMEAAALNCLFPELAPPEPEPTWQDRLDEAIDRIKAAIDVLRYGVPY